MPIESVLAIDTGTQTTRAALVSADGSLLDMASSPLSMSTPRPGWAEQEPERVKRMAEEMKRLHAEIKAEGTASGNPLPGQSRK